MSKDIIRLSGVIKNSIVDGPGFRLTVFCQGCPHHCEGCHNEKTWDFDGGFDGKVEKIINVAKSLPLLQGLTFSGGEPFCQAEAFAELGRLAHENGYNVVTYTGYTYEKLLEGADKHPEWEKESIQIIIRQLLHVTVVTHLLQDLQSRRST